MKTNYTIIIVFLLFLASITILAIYKHYIISTFLIILLANLNIETDEN